VIKVVNATAARCQRCFDRGVVEVDPIARAAPAAGGLMIVRSKHPNSVVRPEPDFGFSSSAFFPDP